MACVGVLESPLTHIGLIVIIRLGVSVILVRLHYESASSGTRCSCCKPVVLVTLGGCHLLDGLWLRRSMQEDCVVLRRRIVRGIVLVPRGSRRATLVERVIELPSLLG